MLQRLDVIGVPRMHTRQPVHPLSLTSGTDRSAQEHGWRLRFPDASAQLDRTSHAAPGTTMTNDPTPEPRLVFPRQAVDAMMACKRAAHQPCALTTEIERTLETMQQKLDELKEDVQNYRFPTLDGPPPLAA